MVGREHGDAQQISDGDDEEHVFQAPPCSSEMPKGVVEGHSVDHITKVGNDSVEEECQVLHGLCLL